MRAGRAALTLASVATELTGEASDLLVEANGAGWKSFLLSEKALQRITDDLITAFKETVR